MRTSPVLLALSMVACSGSDGGASNARDAGVDASRDAANDEHPLDAGDGQDGGLDDAGVQPDAGDAFDAAMDAAADAAMDAAADAAMDAAMDAAADASTDAADAAPDASTDAAIDAGSDAASCPTVLLVGGTDVEAQGWSTSASGSHTLSYGEDYTRVETGTSGLTSGTLLLYLPDAVETGVPFAIQVVMQVESVQAHNLYDSAAAILGSFTPPFGVSNQRGQMIYLDSESIGWADDAQSAAVPVVDGQYHTYEISVDAQSVARVRVDGVEKLTRNGFSTNGTIAIGDQTNDQNVDSALRIRSVTKLCP